MSSYLPTPSVFLCISTDFTPTCKVPVAPTLFYMCSITPLSEVEPRSLKHDLHTRLRNALRPINPDNACTLRITAAAGTKLAGASSSGTVKAANYSQAAPSFQPKELYNPRAFFTHAALLHQACAHCAKFPTAASRRSLGRVSVPVWPVTLSGRLPVVALVSLYLTN